MHKLFLDKLKFFVGQKLTLQSIFFNYVKINYVGVNTRMYLHKIKIIILFMLLLCAVSYRSFIQCHNKKTSINILVCFFITFKVVCVCWVLYIFKMKYFVLLVLPAKPLIARRKFRKYRKKF